MQHRRISIQSAFVPVALAIAIAGGLIGCKSGTRDVTSTDQPADGDGSHVQEEMAAADAHREEQNAQANMETAAGEAANRQLAEAPPPAPPSDAPVNAQPPIAAKPEAKAAPNAAPAQPTEARAEPKAEPKADAKPVVTFLNCDDATAITTRTTDTGLVIEELKLGEGAECKSGATVTINYHGTLKDGGTMFDTTRGKQPATFPLNRLIKGWQQGVPGMKPGGIRRLIIPYALAYGEAGRPPVIPPKSDLVFIIELIQVVEPTK